MPSGIAVRSSDAIEFHSQPLIAYFAELAPGMPRLRVATPRDGSWVHEDLQAGRGDWLRQLDRFELDGSPAIAFVSTVDAYVYFARSLDQPSRPFLRGDANSDLKADVADIVWMVSELFRAGPKSACAAAGDVNADGRYDAADPMALVMYWFQDSAPPPVPFPQCASPMASSPLECESSPCAEA